MKKLLIIILLLLIIPTASAIYVKSSCDERGELSLTLRNNNYQNVYTSELKILADNKEITGDWTSSRFEKSDTEVSFTSHQRQLRYTKKYNIQILHDENTIAQATVSCPGMIYNCELFNITITSCYNYEDEFTAYLKLGGSVPSQNPDITILDPEKDFDYFFRAESEFRDITGNSAKTGALPENAEFTLLDSEDNYLLKIPLNQNKFTSMKASYLVSYIGKCPPAYKPEGDSYDTLTCEIREEEKPIEAVTAQVVKEIPQEPRDYTPFYIIGGFVFAGLLLIAFVIRRRT